MIALPIILILLSAARSATITCGQGEQKVQCKPCESKCINGEKVYVMCTMECIFGDFCGCKPYYLRNTSDNKCIPEEQCTKLTA